MSCCFLRKIYKYLSTSFWGPHFTVKILPLWLKHVYEVGDRSRGQLEAPFSIAATRDVGEGDAPFPGLLHFTLDTYLILLIIKQDSIKYHFWVFGMNRPDIEPRSPGPLANTLLISLVKVKLVTVVESDQKAPFSIATTPRCWGGCYSFSWIAPLYPWYLPHIAER